MVALSETGFGSAQLDTLDRAVRSVAGPPAPAGLTDLVRDQLAEIARGPDRFRDFWRTLFDIAKVAGAAVVHPSRGQVVRGYEVTAERLRLGAAIAKAYEDRTGCRLNEAAELDAAAADLRDFAEDLFARWETEDDLAAMIRVETFPISMEQMEELARRSPPPAEWFQQDDRPF